MAIGRVPGVTGIQPSIVDAKGDLIVATAADSVSRLAVGSNNQRLVADSAEATGLKYVADTQNTVVDAKGDLLVGSAADTLGRLAVGTNGHTLVADSTETTGLKWAAPSAASFVGVALTLPADQTISNTVATALAFGAGSEQIDTDAFHDTSTNNTRITIPSGKGGKYLVIASCSWVGNATGYRELWVQKGASGRIIQHSVNSSGTTARQQNAIGVVSLSAGDYLQMYVEHNSGGNLNINGDFVQETRFEAYLIGA